MPGTLEERITRLEALRDIDTLIADLSRAFDAGPSAQMLRPLFTDDASFKIDRYGTISGGDAIAEGVAGNADQGFKWTLHYLVSPKADLHPSCDRASVDFMLWEAASSARGRAYWIGGRYLATAVKGAKGWQFRSLELQADLISHYPDGWNEKPATLADA
ncbi:nuclear transport factor 2 family protein [Sphingobium chlorophenolicum]|uniref:Iron-binding zinc finger protein, CDGSH type n=1 Tax=Sphingobium chlorophenolicum TaxID=46429 RepID=A0A081RAA7_SPHCR|nr:nuclear transport factor 2 family protein [Sphingobium chlorophenolicum]KEQ52130.1 Iron-binding zinc finger protein, CDGSH type [Sphingobium chlorophenolicum]